MTKLYNIAHSLVKFTNKSLVKNVIIIFLCIVFILVLLFWPFEYYTTAERDSKALFQVGVHYVYEQDDMTQIFDQVSRINELGFKVIRINMHCNELLLPYDDVINQKLDVLYFATDFYGLDVALVIQNDAIIEKIDYYLNRWGSHLRYIQILNEPEFSTGLSISSMFSDDEIISKFNRVYDLVKSHNLPAKLYTNFAIGYFMRSNVPLEISKKLDFVGLDIFMDSFLTLSPHFIQNLQQLTGKDVMITEFGMSTSDAEAQTTFLLKGLNLFKNMGLTGCWLVYWNSQNDHYGIRDSSSEIALGDWIAENAN